MKHQKPTGTRSKFRTLTFAFLLTAAAIVHATSTDIATSPLVTSSSTAVRPNLMFVLDDSGSMDWEYLPDWANTSLCKGSTGVATSSCYTSSRGRPPYLSGNFNGVYYNPAIRYTPPLNADGTSKTSQTSANTAGWTSVKIDGYNIQSTGTINLMTGYPDLEYCTDGTYTDCLRNDNYILPGTVNSKNYTTAHAINVNATSSTNVATGAIASPTTAARTFGPHFYTMVAGEYCTSPNLRTCTTAAAPTPANFYPGKLRWCSDAALTTCQAVKTPTYNKARYPTVLLSGTTGTSATATITVAGSGSTSVSSIQVNGQEILSAATASSSSTGTVAANIRTGINNCTAAIAGNCDVAGFSASYSGSTVTITAPASMGAITFTPAITVVATGSSTATITIVDPPGSNTTTSFSGITVNGQQIMSAASTGNTNVNTVATNVETRIDACTAASVGNCQVAGFSAVRSSNVLTLTAPASMGGITYLPVITKAVGTGNITATATAFVAPGVMTTTPTAFTGGVNPIPSTYVPGSFMRTDIVTGATYGNVTVGGATVIDRSARTDCAAQPSCTYAEEMTNFANWYAYYHTRMQMMKSSTSIAFGPIGNSYRVGYMTIDNNNSDDFLNIGTFDSTQKSNWYAKLFNANPGNNTPLRSALSQAGRIFSGALNGQSFNGVTVTDPMQYACQQNFTILSTDGYWNTRTGYSCNDGKGCKIDGSLVGNQDGSAARPMLDGSNTSDTLADVAYYYYMTDLRPSGSIGALGTDVSEDIVPINGKDTAAHQHMTTFTLGLGADGYLQFSPTYETDSSGDYMDVRNGTTAAGTTCSWQAGGACNWPTPSSDSQANIDDLWHAAVNGRGTYFSAKNPADLATGLSSALAGVSARTGSSAAAATSSQNPVQGDNFAFEASFSTVDWVGELVCKLLDLNTGQVLPTINWAAQTLLDAKTDTTSDTRTIYTYNPGVGNNLKSFVWGNLSAGEQAYFLTANISSLTQWSSLTAAQKTSAEGQNLVNFIRGQTGNEGTLYRSRAHILGDIVSSEPVYVKAPPYNYADTCGGTSYDSFKTTNTTRQGMVYIAANDGMLHAFNADTGQEVWAYVPSLVMSRLYKLVDSNYAVLHQFFVDGTPTVGDACIGGAWKTILVGGLNAGGRGYYALDVTTPSSPSALWEFTYDTAAGSGYTKDANLGYTFGNPVITKSGSTWVVLTTSGYNNVNPGDGKGYLYVLNAANGTILNTTSTNTGSTSTITGICSVAPCPSGLSRINAWTDYGMLDNTALRAYGGDLFGNLWRFNLAGGAQQIAYFRSSTGDIQPITEKPELGDVSGNAMVFVGTGRFLGASDMSDASQQTFYAVKDTLAASSIGNARANSGMVRQTLTTTTDASGATVRTTTNNAVNLASDTGWYIELPDSGERSYTDPALALGTLMFTSNTPKSSACTAGGESWIYFLDYRTGSFVSTSGEHVAARKLGNALATRPLPIRLPNNSVVSLTRLSDSTTVTTNIPVGGSTTATRRVSWRELISDH